MIELSSTLRGQPLPHASPITSPRPNWATRPLIRKDYLPFGRPNFSQEEIDAVARVMRSGWVGMGPEVAAFEQELAAAIGAPHVVTVSSCTAALHLSLLLHDVGRADEVICPSLTWCSSANAALYLGARVVFCDVDPFTLCVTAETILAKVTPRTKAVVVVHLGGLAIDVQALRARLPGRIAIIEDAAHALGAQYPNGKPVGSSGNLTCFSFYANKNVSTAEGGAIALFDGAASERLRSLRQHGFPADAWKRYIHASTLIRTPLVELGYKANYTDLQASIGRVQLRRLPELARLRLAVATRYARALPGLEPAPVLQNDLLSERHARHLFLVQLPVERMTLNRDEALGALRKRNVGATVHYAPLHRMPLYAEYAGGSLPETERICERILTLPISASMSADDADYVLTHLRELIRSPARKSATRNSR